MIGIAGWVDTTPGEADPEVLERMLSALRHRGARHRSHRSGGAAIGVVGTERDELPHLEHPAGVSVVDGWMRPGAWPPGGLEPALAGARGEFTALDWDRGRRRLTLARDPLGVRSLYVFSWGSGLAFASEIKAILQHPRVAPALDPACVAELLAYRYVAGSRTVFRGIREVGPGRVVVWTDGRLTERAYWELPYGAGDGQDSAAGYAARAEAALQAATEEAGTVSPATGVLLSGGLDSSLVTALFVRGRAGVRTWSAGSPDPRLDESERASFVARALGCEHGTRAVDGAEYAATLPESIRVNDEPLHHPNCVALLLLARDAARHVDALLMGEGADSSFGNRAAMKLKLALTLRGLPRALLAPLLAGAQKAGYTHAAALRSLVETEPDAFALASNQFTPAALARTLAGGAGPDDVLGERAAMMESGGTLDPVARLLRYYQRTELLASFNVFGKMLAGAGIEARMPFGSRPVQEITCRMPSALKVSLRGTAKPLLVRIARGLLPAEIVGWPKMSFGYPMGRWMRRGGSLAPYVRLLERADARTRGVLDPVVLRRVVEENEQGRGNHGEGALFAAVNLEIWLRVHVAGTSPGAVAEEAAELAKA